MCSLTQRGKRAKSPSQAVQKAFFLNAPPALLLYICLCLCCDLRALISISFPLFLPLVVFGLDPSILVASLSVSWSASQSPRPATTRHATFTFTHTEPPIMIPRLWSFVYPGIFRAQSEFWRILSNFVFDKALTPTPGAMLIFHFCLRHLFSGIFP